MEICTMKNGDAYEGEWKNDLEHGRSILRLSNGTIYDGRWEDGVKFSKID